MTAINNALLTRVLDRDTKETTYYTDIKPESLRKVLRTVLQRVDVISLDEAELSVTWTSPRRNS